MQIRERRKLIRAGLSGQGLRDSTDVVDGKAGNDRQQEINSKRKSGKFFWCFFP